MEDKDEKAVRILRKLREYAELYQKNPSEHISQMYDSLMNKAIKKGVDVSGLLKKL